MSRAKIVFGNRPDWFEHIVTRLSGDNEPSTELLNSAHATSPYVFIPIDLPDYEILRANTMFANKAIFPSVECVRICNDKQLFREWFLSHFSEKYLTSKNKLSQFSIAKPRISFAGQGSFLIENSNLVELTKIDSNQEYCLENYIPGSEEFSFHLLFDQGEIIFSAKASFVHSRGVYIHGSNYHECTTLVEICNHTPEIFHQLLKKLNYSGTVCIDYKIDETGQIKILEVNPRMGWSLIHCINAYVNAYTNHIKKIKKTHPSRDNRPMNKNFYIVEEGPNPSTDYFVLPALLDQQIYIHRCKWDQLPQAQELTGSTVIFIRYIPKAWVRLINAIRPKLANLIYFMDDDLLDTSSTKALSWRYRFKVASLATWHKNWLIRQHANIWVSTPSLKEKYALLKPTLLLPQPIHAIKGVCRVFYHGSASHNDEINWLYPIIKKVLTKNENIVFEIIGGDEVNKKYRTLSRVNIVHPMKWPAYQIFLATQGRHIGLAPLVETSFNKSRSYTKFFDITRAGAAGIYATQEPYSAIITDKKNGLLINRDPDSWVSAILLLATDENFRSKIIEQAQLTVKNLTHQHENSFNPYQS
jgi:hypothetical protein